MDNKLFSRDRRVITRELYKLLEIIQEGLRDQITGEEPRVTYHAVSKIRSMVRDRVAELKEGKSTRTHPRTSVGGEVKPTGFR